MENQKKYKKYARGNEPEMANYFAEYGEQKEKWGETQQMFDDNRVLFNERSPAELEIERKLNQALSFLPQERKKAEIEKVLDHADSKEVKFGQVSIDSGALMVMLAENYQRTEASISPQAEYYVWREVTDKLVVELNTDGASVQEVSARGSFIDFLENREAEMKMVMSLYYAASANGNGYYQELAKNQLTFMRFKMSELRRFKAKMQATPSMANAEELQKQKEKNLRKIYEPEVNTLELAARSIGGRAVQLGAAESLRRHVDEMLIGNEMEHGAAEHFVRFNPPTHSVGEAEKRIEVLTERQIIMGQRMGLSKDEVIEIVRKRELGTEKRPLSRESIFMRRYNELQNAG